MTARASCIVALVATASYFGFAQAALSMEQGFYVGGFYGEVQRETSKREDLVEFDAIKFAIYADQQVTPELNNPSLSRDDSTFGFVFGYRWLPHLGFEGSYLDLGDVTFRSADIVSVDGDAFGLNTRIRARVRGPALSVMGVLPITYEWELFGRAGVLLASSSTSIRLDTDFTTLAGDFDEDNADWLAGVGLQYTFYDIYTLRAEIQRVFDAGDEDSTGEFDTDLASLSLMVSF